MAQVNVNFRLDEDVKRRMEHACKEMGLSMTTAFTMFAAKVGREKRIPFEIAAAPSPGRYGGAPERPAPPEPDDHVPARALERLEGLCVRIRRSLTAIHTAIPSAALGLEVERIRLLCADELKDKLAACASSFRGALSGRNADGAADRDLELLEEYTLGLAAIRAEVERVETALIPALRACTGEVPAGLDTFAERLSALSGQFDELQALLARFLGSSAKRQGTAHAVLARVRRAADPVSHPNVADALHALEAQVRRWYDALDAQTKGRLEALYLPTMELALEELAEAERWGEDTSAKAELALRAVQVVSQAVSSGVRAQRELSDRSLEAEVTALERIAALRGDAAGDMGG